MAMTYDDLTHRFLTYDPNTSTMWGVYNGTNFKAYAHLGHAVSSFNYQFRARLFMMTTDRGWVEAAIKDGRTRGQCEFCGDLCNWQGWRKVRGKQAKPPQYGFACDLHRDLWVA